MIGLAVFGPLSSSAVLLLGIPLNAAILMKFAPMGPFMTELYPTNIRGIGQGNGLPTPLTGLPRLLPPLGACTHRGRRGPWPKDEKEPIRAVSRINVSQADGVATIRIDIAAGSMYLRSCPSETQSTSAPPLDFSEMGIIPPGLRRMLGASRAIRSGGRPCSPRARRSRRDPARS